LSISSPTVKALHGEAVISRARLLSLTGYCSASFSFTS